MKLMLLLNDAVVTVSSVIDFSFLILCLSFVVLLYDHATFDVFYYGLLQNFLFAALYFAFSVVTLSNFQLLLLVFLLNTAVVYFYCLVFFCSSLICGMYRFHTKLTLSSHSIMCIKQAQLKQIARLNILMLWVSLYIMQKVRM